MQAHRFGNLAQRQWSHGNITMIEKCTLTINNSLRHAQDGVKALLHILDEPFGFLQLAGQPGSRAT